MKMTKKELKMEIEMEKTSRELNEAFSSIETEIDNERGSEVLYESFVKVMQIKKEMDYPGYSICEFENEADKYIIGLKFIKAGIKIADDLVLAKKFKSL